MLLSTGSPRMVVHHTVACTLLSAHFCRTYHQCLPMRHFTVHLSHLRQQQQQPQLSASTIADVMADRAAASTATNTGTGGSSSSSSTESSGSPAEPVANNNATDQQPAATPEVSQPQQQHQQLPQLDGCVPGEAAAGDDDEDHPVLPITRVAYQQGSSNECCLWLGGPASGQVSQNVTPSCQQPTHCTVAGLWNIVCACYCAAGIDLQLANPDTKSSWQQHCSCWCHCVRDKQQLVRGLPACGDSRWSSAGAGDRASTKVRVSVLCGRWRPTTLRDSDRTLLKAGNTTCELIAWLFNQHVCAASFTLTQVLAVCAARPA